LNFYFKLSVNQATFSALLFGWTLFQQLLLYLIFLGCQMPFLEFNFQEVELIY
jgi:hypothetical protein